MTPTLSSASGRDRVHVAFTFRLPTTGWLPTGMGDLRARDRLACVLVVMIGRAAPHGLLRHTDDMLNDRDYEANFKACER